MIYYSNSLVFHVGGSGPNKKDQTQQTKQRSIIGYNMIGQPAPWRLALPMPFLHEESVNIMVTKIMLVNASTVHATIYQDYNYQNSQFLFHNTLTKTNNISSDLLVSNSTQVTTIAVIIPLSQLARLQRGIYSVKFSYLLVVVDVESDHMPFMYGPQK